MKNKKIISCLFTILMLTIALTANFVIKANAAEGRLYNQIETRWEEVAFTRYASTGNTLRSSGCGIFSFCNAIYALNDNIADAVEVATWAVDVGAFQPGNGGTYRQPFYNKVEAAFGEELQFKIDGQYWGKITDSRLINHLQNGGVAVIHVYNHFMAVTGYDDGLYRVIESAVSVSRGLDPVSWATASKMSSGNTNVDWYVLITNTKPPTDEWHQELSPADLGQTFCARISNAGTNEYLTNDYRNVAAYPDNASADQAWIFNKQPDNSYVITSLCDIARLTVYNQENTNRTNVIVTSADDVDLCQQWFIYETDNGYIFRPAHSGRVLDLTELNEDGQGEENPIDNLQLYEFNDSPSQYYHITRETWYDYYTPADLGTNFCAKIYNNKTEGFLQNDGQNVAVYSETNQNHQVWYFIRQADGSYVITSLLDNAKLMSNAYETDNVSVINEETSDYQKWLIYETDKGYLFRPVYSDKVLDTFGIGYEDGTNIGLYEMNGTFAQFYSIKLTGYSYSIQFDATGGFCPDSSKSVHYGEVYGILPEPERNGYAFIGWYTSENDGTEITADMQVTITENQTLYAHWEKMNIPGDCNDDGVFNADDVVMLQKWLLHTGELINWQNADLYEDGVINTFDLILMKHQLLSE